MKPGDNITKFASMMIVWCMISTAFIGLIMIASPVDVEGASVAKTDDLSVVDKRIVFNDGITVLGYNLTIGSGGVVIFQNTLVNVTQNYNPDAGIDLMYHIIVEDGGELVIINSTVTNILSTQNDAAPGLGIIVRNGATMFAENSTFAFPGHFIIDDADLVMINSVVKGLTVTNCDSGNFPSDYFDDAPVMMFISANVMLYGCQLIDVFTTNSNHGSDLFSFSYPFATDDSNRDVVTYILERNVEGNSALAMDDSLVANILNGGTVTTTGVDIAGLTFASSEVASIRINVEYSADYSYTGSDAFYYTLPNGTSVRTAATVSQTSTDPSDTTKMVIRSDALDLLTYPMSSQDLANTVVNFTNTGGAAVHVSRVWFEVSINYDAYSNINLAGNTTFTAVNTVLDINNGNYTTNDTTKLLVTDQAKAFLYGTTITNEIPASPGGIAPIVCENDTVVIQPGAKSTLDDTGDSLSDLMLNDGAYYVIGAGDTFDINQFITDGLTGEISGAILHIRYLTDLVYGGSNYLNWSIGSGPQKYTTINFAESTSETEVTFDLYNNGVNTIDDISNLNLTYFNNGVGLVQIDQMWIEITIDPIAYIYRFASFNVTDKQNLPVEGASVELVNTLTGNPSVYVSPDGITTVPPQDILNYLGRTASDYNVTDTYGKVTVPVLTDIITTGSLPRSIDLYYGIRTNMRYDVTISYLNGTSVLFDETVAVSFDQYPSMGIMSLNLDVTMNGLYLDKPDLQVINPGHTPTIVYAGQTVTLNVTVINYGVTTAQYVVVKIVDVRGSITTTLGTVNAGNLTYGESAQISIQWTPSTSGLHSIQFIVDPLDAISEEYDNNNQVSLSINVLASLPELSVSGSDIGFSMIPAMTNTPLTITSIVRNTDGRAAAVNATVAFYLGNPLESGILIGTSKVNVSAGGQVTASIEWIPNVVGKYTVYVVVGGVAEYTYDNNTAYRNLTIYVAETGQLEVNDTIGRMTINGDMYEKQNIIISENGTLVLNAAVFFVQNAANDYWIVVKDNGSLILNANGLITSYYALTVYLANNANLTIIGASAQTTSTITVVADDNSTVYISGATVAYNFIAPSTSKAGIVAYDTTFTRGWSYFGGDAQADLTSVAIPSLDPSDDAVVKHYRWISVTTYDGTGAVKLSGAYVELRSWNSATSTYYASGVSDSNAKVKFKALCDIITSDSITYVGNYKLNGTYSYGGISVYSDDDVNVGLLYYSAPLSMVNVETELIIPVVLTDVSIVSSDIKVTPTKPTTNETATVSVTVRNLGSQAADGTVVSIYLNRTGTLSLIATRTITSLPAKQNFTVSVSWIPNAPGTEVITVVLDAGHVLNESTRGNNIASASVVVLAVPHIYVSDISFYLGSGTTQITSAIVGSSVTIKARLFNNGESDTTSFTVSFWLNSPTTGTLISTATVTKVAVGGTYNVTASWEATSVSGGGAYQNRTIYVTIDEVEYTLSTDVPQSQTIMVIDNRPDLIVDSNVAITKGGVSVVNASLGETIIIKFNVTNVGLTAAQNAKILLNLTVGTTDVKISNFTVTLTPQETEQYNVTYLVTGLALQTYDLNIWANPNQTFKEASTANNHYVTDFSVVVLEDPDIAVKLISGGQTEFAPGDKITVSGSVMSKDGMPIVGQQVKISLTDSKGFQIGTAQTRTTDEEGTFLTVLNISPDYDKGSAYVTATINDGTKEVSNSTPIKITSEEGLPIPLWLILLIIVVIVLVIVFFSWYLYRYSLGKMVECGECGSLIPEASKRCPKCGTIFETGTAKCSECGAWIPANATECPECHAKFLNVSAGTEQAGSYDEIMKKQYDEYVNGYRQQAMAALGAKYSEDKFQEWLKTEPGFLTYDAWLKKVEEDKKQGAFACPACGTLNPRGSTICHKCGSVFSGTEKPTEEKPRTFRKIVKRDKKEGEDEQKPPENK